MSAGLKIANDYPGADIGAKINAACADLPNGGVVVVLPGDYEQTTKVVIEEGITLKLGVGTFSNTFADSYYPPWQMKDNTSIIGSGWGTKLMHNVAISGAATAVSDFNSLPNNDVQGNSNLVLRDLSIIGNPLSESRVQSSAVQFGNIRNALIDHCFFKDCAGYACFQVSSSISGRYGDGFVVQNCTFEEISTQQCGVINCANWRISGNTFRPTSVDTNYTVVDCESNVGTDRLTNWQITDNTFDFKTSAIFNPGAMIQVVGQNPTPYNIGRAAYGVIKGNVCVSGGAALISPNWASFAQGISLIHCDTVVISDNHVAYCSTPLGLGDCNSITVANNVLQGGKSDDSGTLSVTQSFDCLIVNNKLTEHNGVNWGTPSIVESGGSDYNVYRGNHVSFYPDTAPSSILREARIVLEGAHSIAVENVLGHATPCPVDAPLIATIAELRQIPIPGGRHASHPAVVLVGGYAAQADGGFSVWKYDPSSSAADNGITVVIPQYRSLGTGAWLRAVSAVKMSTVTRDALSLGSSDASLIVYNTTTKAFEFWDGTDWQHVGGMNGITVENTVAFGAPHVYGNDGTNQLYVSANGVGPSRGGTGFGLFQDDAVAANSFGELSINDKVIALWAAMGFGSVDGPAHLKRNLGGNDVDITALGAWGQVWAFLYATVPGGTLTSGATIAPTHGIHSLTGTTPITTITPPTSDPAGTANDFKGTITFLPTANAVLSSSGGNINNDFTATAGVPFTATFDGSKWWIK